jgi:hypothetical protein
VDVKSVNRTSEFSCPSGATPIYDFAVLRQLDHVLLKFLLRMFRPASTQPTKSEGVEDRLKFSGARILLGHHAMTGEMRFWEQEAAHQDSEMISHARFDRRPSPIRSRPTHATDTSFLTTHETLTALCEILYLRRPT